MARAQEEDVVTEQPESQYDLWGKTGPDVNTCPPGMEFLNQIDQVLVEHQVDWFEVLFDLETPHKYIIRNAMGQQIYTASEESTFLMRTFFGMHRSFIFRIFDNNGLEVIRISRPSTCDNCAFGCACFINDNSDFCSPRVSIDVPPGNPVGYYLQKHSYNCWKPVFSIRDKDNTELYTSLWPSDWPLQWLLCCEKFNSDTDYPIYDTEGKKVGSIAKIWSGLFWECWTKVNKFNIKFDRSMDVKQKATLIGAVFLMDFLRYEGSHEDDAFEFITSIAGGE